VVICLERGADLHMAQLMPLPLTISCFSKIQIGFTFLVPAHLCSPGKSAVKRVCVCVCVCLCVCVCVCVIQLLACGVLLWLLGEAEWSLLQSLVSFAREMQSLQLNDTQLALLCALVLVNPSQYYWHRSSSNICSAVAVKVKLLFFIIMQHLTRHVSVIRITNRRRFVTEPKIISRKYLNVN